MADVSWTTDNANLTAIPGATQISVKGTVPGTYQVIATRRDTSIVRIPNTPIQGIPVTITVTP